jgi:hypothetical protein
VTCLTWLRLGRIPACVVDYTVGTSKLRRIARVIGTVVSVAVCVAALGFVATQTVLQSSRPRLDYPASAPLLVQPSGLAPVPQSAPAAPAAAQASGASQVDDVWLAKTAARAGIPIPALRAYADAQLAAPARCGIGWTTLAGIGWVESQHGTLDGRRVTEDGHSSKPILGPELDGDPFAAIPATPQSTAWHGNPDWDHAVGPMQFIPSTWKQWGTDGDADGIADPNDLDDAARTAVAYLCADGHDLGTGTGWSNAIFSYNHDAAYVANVHHAATTYSQRTS